MDRKVVVITGASSGIGAALAERLAGRGDAVVLAARRAEALRAVAGRCGDRASMVVADVTKRDDVRRIIATARSERGRIDVWVNNAGQGITRLPSQLTDEDVDGMIAVNVKSVLYGMQEALALFKEQGDGHIINISSMLGRIPYAPYRSAYCGAKHFVNALTATFRDEIRQTHPNIHVSLVSPGVVYTEFGANAEYGGPDSRELPDGQTAEDVAAVIARVVDTRTPDVYTRAGFRARVVEYYRSLPSDPE